MRNKDIFEMYDTLNIKKLSSLIKKSGFTFNLIKRNKKIFIYKKCKFGRVIAYEVFKNKLLKPCFFYGEEGFDFRESYPGDEDFGKRAWTYSTLEKSLKKYETINAQV